MAEGLSEEELALFDILTKPEPVLTKAEEAEVKKACRDLLATLKREKLARAYAHGYDHYFGAGSSAYGSGGAGSA